MGAISEHIKEFNIKGDMDLTSVYKYGQPSPHKWVLYGCLRLLWFCNGEDHQEVSWWECSCREEPYALESSGAEETIIWCGGWRGRHLQKMLAFHRSRWEKKSECKCGNVVVPLAWCGVMLIYS